MIDPNELWDPEDHPTMRRRIEATAIAELGKAFPAEYGGVRLRIENPVIGGPSRITPRMERDAIMRREYLARPLKADVILEDASTGQELDRKNSTTLMKVPWYTDRGTFIHNGNNYSGLMQSRMIPGGYTRRQNNGVLETQFNVRVRTGKPFRIALDPEKAQFRLRVKGSDLHLYSVLRDLGVKDEELEAAWGGEILQMNQAKYDPRALPKAVAKMTRRANDSIPPAEALRDALSQSQVAKKIINRTLAAYWPAQAEKQAARFMRLTANLLNKRAAEEFVDDEGDEYVGVGVPGVLAATRKLLAVNRGQDEVDQRHVPAFSKILTLDKLLGERIRFDEGKRRRVLMRRLAARKNLSPLAPGVFDGYMEEFMTKNSLTMPGEETNATYLVSQHRRVTQMGPGGIGSLDAVTSEMQAVQASEFGFYSPIEGPESAAAGIDVRLAAGVRIGPDGRMYRRVKDRNGNKVWVSPETLWGATLRLPQH